MLCIFLMRRPDDSTRPLIRYCGHGYGCSSGGHVAKAGAKYIGAPILKLPATATHFPLRTTILPGADCATLATGKTLMRPPYLNKQHAPHVPNWPCPFAETIALQHAWPRRPPWCRLCEPGGTKTLMRHPYLNEQHAPHVLSWGAPAETMPPPTCLATATSTVQVVRAWPHENAYAPPLT